MVLKAIFCYKIMNVTIHPQNTLKKSDKKFVRLEKARIRSRFLDFKKQEEMITELYKRFEKKPVVTAIKDAPVKEEVKAVKITKEAKSLKAKKESRKAKVKA